MVAKISRRSVGRMAGAVFAAMLLSDAARADAGALEAAAKGLPLVVGQRFGRWVITALHRVQNGAQRIGVKGRAEREFVLEVLARDPAPRAACPPAMTDGLAIFVCNGGDGTLPTQEEQGLAAMMLAEMLQVSGHGGPIAGLLTHAERLARNRATAREGFSGAW